MKAGKYIIEIKEIDECPSDWTSRGVWASNGIYKIKNEDWCLYIVSDNHVNYFETSTIKNHLEKYVEEQENNVSEDLFLKALSAAVNSKRLD